jgi:NAD(P)-dependent dehydrogenase (short-subunit alcohol dehydrogenase family)
MTGKETLMGAWGFDDIPDQSGRVVIVTGANSGIGFETARALALKGARVTLACRSFDRGRAAVERISGALAADGHGAVSLEQLDLADISNIRAFAERYASAHDRLDLLILNAGVMVPPESTTAQGFELQFGVNHLGHFALTGWLLSLMRATPGSRVVVVSSTAAFRGVMHFDDLQFAKRGYAPWRAYAQSKLANQLYALELQRRLRAAGDTTLVTAAHPGWTATELQRSTALARLLNHFIAMQPSQGALPILRAATDPEAHGGDYYGPDGLLQMRGHPKRIDMVKRARNAADAARLWQISEELTGVRYELPAMS